MSTNVTHDHNNRGPELSVWFISGTMLLSVAMMGATVYGLSDPDGFVRKKYKLASSLGLTEKSDILRCEEPGIEVDIEDRNRIIFALGNYSEQPGVSLNWDPKKVICTVEDGGILSFHIEKSEEDLVKAAEKAEG